MIKGFDCASHISAEVLARAVDRGFAFAGRYYGTGGKVLKPDEAAILAAADFPLISYFERTAGRAAQGAVAGVEDADLALEQAAAVGQPHGTPVYFAVDFDADLSDLRIDNGLCAYFEAVHNSNFAMNYLVGVYGSGAVCDRMLSTGFAHRAAEAGAEGWQGSRAFEGWHLKQHAEIQPGSRFNELGIGYDLLECRSLDEAGAWLPPGTRDALPPLPAQHGPVRFGDRTADAKLLQQKLMERGYDVGPAGADGWFGKRSDAAFWRWVWKEFEA